MKSAPTNDRKRTGKVARLPKALRDEVNTRLQNGGVYREIAAWLNKQEGTGTGSFNEENLRAWFHGGHQDWLKQQTRTDEIRARAEASLAMVQALSGAEGAGDGTLHITAANELLLASQINEALSEFEPEALKQLLRDDPAKFFSMASAIAGQSNERTKREKLELDFRKYRDHVEEAKAKLLAATSAAKSAGGLSAETLREIEEAAGLL